MGDDPAPPVEPLTGSPPASAHPRRAPASRAANVLGVLGVLALVAAGALLLPAAHAWRAAERHEQLVEQPTPAVAPSVPPTIPPAAPVTTPAPVPVTDGPPATTEAGALDTLPAPRWPAPAPASMPAPVAVTVDAIGLRAAPVVPVGVLADGELEVPGAKEVGWYQSGARPGEAGSTVLAAHVSWNGQPGRFAALAAVAPGARIVVTLADGSTRQYTAVERAVYDKDQLPADRVWASSGPETLVLITCGGRFNPSIRRFKDNVVVYAVPVAATAAPQPATATPPRPPMW